MRKIDKNPFPFAMWPDNRLEKAGTRVNDPAYVEKTKALIGALADQNEEFMPLGPEWDIGDNAFASRIGDHGAYAGTFQPETGELYIDWLGMNPGGNLNDEDTRAALYDQWHKMGVRKIKYSPEKDLEAIQRIPHKQWGRIAGSDDLEQRNITVNRALPKFIRRDWTPKDDGSFTSMRNGKQVIGDWNDVLADAKDLGSKLRDRLFGGLINGFENYAKQNGGFLPTPTPTSTPESTSTYTPLLDYDVTKTNPKPTKTARPWTPIGTPVIDPDYYPDLHQKYGMPTYTPEPPASNMTMPTPTPTPIPTPVKPVLPTTLSQPTPTLIPRPGGFTTPEPTPKPGGFTPPEPTPKPGGFSVPKIQSNNNWFNFAIHPAIKQP